LEVLPAEKQRTGIGTMLLKKLIEAAKERGVHLIYHHAQSLEGLLIIKNKLVVPERKYWDPKNGKELQYEEAVEILQQKKDKGVEDIGTFVQTTTVVDELED